MVFWLTRGRIVLYVEEGREKEIDDEEEEDVVVRVLCFV